MCPIFQKAHLPQFLLAPSIPPPTASTLPYQDSDNPLQNSFRSFSKSSSTIAPSLLPFPHTSFTYLQEFLHSFSQSSFTPSPKLFHPIPRVSPPSKPFSRGLHSEGQPASQPAGPSLNTI
ncbi:hypothetical protein Pcinc_039048 [Petrolisthes cinctipes]|uniref:Uncharacterized protein n=1 Tax=Petrolisthes cinctipes TaxID=88211 RepID=A0AAE1BS71_PETCI|nr:hypothetical protein Pcinc_039048 [Petrolisthes cinctipes]